MNHVSSTVGRASQTDMTAVLSGRMIRRTKRGDGNGAGWSPVNCGKVEVDAI